MLLFLASSAAKTLDKFTSLLSRSPREMTVAYIPTAGDLYTDKSWMEADRNKLVELGFQIEDVDIKAFRKEELKQKLSGKDIIFVAGGTTTYLLDKSRQSGFDEIVKDLVKTGTIYIGSSAGAVLAGPTVEIDRIYDHRHLGKELESYAGLGLVDFVVLPHADNVKYELIIKDIVEKFADKYEFKKLNDNQAIIVSNGDFKVVEA